MASTSTNSHHHHQQHHQQLHSNITQFIQSTTSNLFSLLNPTTTSIKTTAQPPPPFSISATSSIHIPFLLPSPILSLSTTTTSSPPSDDDDDGDDDGDGGPINSSQIKSMSPNGARSAAFPSSFKISGLSSRADESGPAFVGQVFSMCDVSGTGLMAVSTHIEIPFISKRTPEWINNMFSIFKKGNDGPVFRFFMDLGDAVSYVKRLNIPTGVVGACRLDLAYEHFKEKPHMFEFIPNKKQVKAANKILKKSPHSGGRNIDGVPVFTSQNLDIAIATSDGIKWYTPYFFDKTMLDNILEESVDQHFHSLIQIRHMQRRRDVIDDNVTAEVVEDNADNMWEPPEVQEVLDEIGYPGVPLSVVSKAAEMQLLYAVDKVLLGNRWLRKATGIQPKFPYRVDSFQKRSAASFLRAAELTTAAAREQLDSDNNKVEDYKEEHTEVCQREPTNNNHFRLPFGDWFFNLIQPKQQKKQNEPIRLSDTMEESVTQLPLSPLLPKITMVGISTGDAGQVNKASLKKTMEDLTKELEEPGQNNTNNNSRNDLRHEDRDPLFVANVGV